MTPQLPDDEQAVRRLLADARHDEGTPPEVVARLDEVLAGLVAERSPAPVVDLAARRRRIRASLVLAAAAVVVAGVGIGQVVSSTGGSDEMSASDEAATATQDRMNGDAEDVGPQDSGGDAGDRQYSAGEERLPDGGARNQSGAVPQPLPALSEKNLRADLALLREDTQSLRALREEAGRDATMELSCTTTEASGRGRVVEATYDGRPVTVVFRPERERGQRVDLYGCDGTTPLRSVWLPLEG